MIDVVFALIHMSESDSKPQSNMFRHVWIRNQHIRVFFDMGM